MTWLAPVAVSSFHSINAWAVTGGWTGLRQCNLYLVEICKTIALLRDMYRHNIAGNAVLFGGLVAAAFAGTRGRAWNADIRRTTRARVHAHGLHPLLENITWQLNNGHTSL